MNKEKFDYSKHTGFERPVWHINEITEKEVQNEQDI